MSDRDFSSNPFSTRFVRPGAIEYFFPAGWSAERLIDELSANGWRGAIVGPHGSGKSSLLATLLPKLAERHVAPWLISLHDGQHWLPKLALPEALAHRRPVLVIDGYEQLNCLSRWWVDRQCRRTDCGLLVTAHNRVALPTLFQTRPSEQLLAAIAERLQSPSVAIITPTDISSAYAQTAGNLREALFNLYDRYEPRFWRTANPGQVQSVDQT